MNRIFISPSVLGLPVDETPNKIKELMKSGADMIHFDVMDGKFVPNKSFSFDDFKKIKAGVDKSVIFDVHLMVENVQEYVKKYLKLGADIITFHYEAINPNEIQEVVQLIHEANKRVGIAVKPDTNIKKLDNYLDLFDLVLVMSVEPGFGGQKFNAAMLEKVKYLSTYKKEHNLNYAIEIDGGINDYTAKMSIEDGVDYLVSGSFILKSEDMEKAITSLRN